MEKNHNAEYRRIIAGNFKEAEEMMDVNDPDDVEYLRLLREARLKAVSIKRRKKIKEIIVTAAIVISFVAVIWLRICT